jgi:hypothetical protein
VTVIAFLAAAVVVLFIVVWAFAYKMGERQGQRSVLSHTDPEDAAVITGNAPAQIPNTQLPPAPASSASSQSPATAPPKATPAPAGAMPPVVQADPRLPGNNYLELCPLTWKDAEPAVRFLQSHGIRATAIPRSAGGAGGGGVDLAKPQPNNPFLIIVDQPIPSGHFKASKAQADALMAEVRRLGKKWQTEHRGASDFADPMWRLQRGK